MTKTLCFLLIFFIQNAFNYHLAQTNSANSLKAILIVGPQEDETTEATRKMDAIADLLKRKGVLVYKFYGVRAKWNKIVETSKDCSFFIYSGHGSNQGVNSNTGGLCLSNDNIVSTKTILAELQLKKGALVLFQSVCGGAGASASDRKEIELDQAKQRVIDYAYPFFEIGASAYYANNFVGGVYDFLRDFLNGSSLFDAYQESVESTGSNSDLEESYSRDNEKTICIAADDTGGVVIKTSYVNGHKKVEKVRPNKEYSIAMVGKKEFSLKDMK